MVDSQLSSRLLNKGNAPQPPRLLDVPTMTIAPGSPTIWGLGRRVRLPVHVMFQSDKVRESGGGGKTNPSTGALRRVFSDVALLLNTRKSQRIVRLDGSGKALILASRNFRFLQSDAMVASSVGGRLRLTAGSVEDPDFADTFAVDDRILL